MSQKSVLIVDDSSSFRTVVKLSLMKAGYEVVEAVDGQDAVTKLDGKKFHCIVCDVNMPRMDGISFVKHMKTTNYKFIPVVMLTTESQESKKEEGRAAGVRAWLTKPFQPALLVDTIGKLCV